MRRGGALKRKGWGGVFRELLNACWLERAFYSSEEGKLRKTKLFVHKGSI
jgi:hypothetical protein